VRRRGIDVVGIMVRVAGNWAESSALAVAVADMGVHI
jgi:hypothetical protein